MPSHREKVSCGAGLHESVGFLGGGAVILRGALKKL